VSGDEKDFVYAVSGDSRLQKINPSGTLLWKINIAEKILYPPLPGRDGRVFVTSEKSLSCYDTHGKRKWHLVIPPPRFSPLELNDGSLLVILKETQTATQNSAAKVSAGIRISPYGALLEEIAFSGIISGAAVTDSGALLAFTSGMYGLCAVSENQARSSWTSEGIGTSAGIPVASGKQAALLFSQGDTTRVRFVSAATGAIYADLGETLPINTRNLAYAVMQNGTLVAADSRYAIAVDTNALKDARNAQNAVPWFVTLPDKKQCKFIAYTQDGLLYLSGTNWVTAAYKVTQTAGSSSQSNRAVIEKKTYQKFASDSGLTASLNPFSGQIDVEELNAISRGLTGEDYGARELAWYNRVNSWSPQLVNRYSSANQNSSRIDNSALFTTTVQDAAQLVSVMGQFGSDSFCRVIARVIQNESDAVMLRNAVKAAAEIAYDPEGVMLDALAVVQQKKGDASLNAVYMATCDAVYEICSYMGLRALTTKGKIILNTFFTSRFNSQVRDYARDTMKKML
jgi:hypothetical protein